MRYHELALVRWLNRIFIVREGYPVPCLLSSPMDAFAHFRNLWADANNPFSYLLALKDENGTPLYEPHPSPVRYPIISVHRKSWKPRPHQNFSIHRMRHINWPAVSDAGSDVPGKSNVGIGLTKFDLGNVTTARFPMAWNYRFQIDHFCLRPDTQAFFLAQLTKDFWRTGGPEPQTWIPVPYPGWGEKLIRAYIDGDIENMTPEEPEQDKNVEFRTSFTLVVEGFDVDLDYRVFPAFWTLIIGAGNSVDPTTLENGFAILAQADERIDNANPTLDSRVNVPSAGNLSTVYRRIGLPDNLLVEPISVVAINQFGEMSISSS